MWSGLIIVTNADLLKTRKAIKQFFSGDEAAMRMSRRLEKYAKINTRFGILLCVFQVLVGMINTWFNEEVSASLINLGFDITCLGVAGG